MDGVQLLCQLRASPSEEEMPPPSTPSAFSRTNATARHDTWGNLRSEPRGADAGSAVACPGGQSVERTTPSQARGLSRCSFAEGALTGHSPVPAILRSVGADARQSAESFRSTTAQRKLALVHSLQRRTPVSSLPEIKRYPLVIVRPPRPLDDVPAERRAGGARSAGHAESDGSHWQADAHGRSARGATSARGTVAERGSPPRLARTPCTPRTHERKSRPEASDEPERGLLSGELTLGSGPRGRSAARRAKPPQSAAIRARPEPHAADARAQMLPLRVAVSASYEHDAPHWPVASPPHIRTFESGPSSMDWERSADDRAAASALAMLFECASQVEERGGRSR